MADSCSREPLREPLQYRYLRSGSGSLGGLPPTGKGTGSTSTGREPLKWFREPLPSKTRATPERWWTENAWGNGFGDAEAWLDAEQPDLETLLLDGLTLPAFDNEWLSLYQAGWCAAIEFYLDSEP